MSVTPQATLYIAASLNGLITKGADDSSWVAAGDEEIFAKVGAETGCVLVGRKTFEQYQGSIYPVPNALNVVLSSNVVTSDNAQVVYVKNLTEAQQVIAARGFTRFMVAGGAAVIAACLQARLIDKIYLSLHPYIFGTGLSVIGDYAGDMALDFISIHHQHADFLVLEYNVRAYR